jgi:5-methylthioadenosine/S-adenosylhomocysteine deaminase
MGSLLVRNGELLEAHGATERGDLLIVDGRIAARGPNLVPTEDIEVLDAGGSIVMPGLVNAHTHSNQTLEKGLSDALPLDAWMVIASYGGAGAVLSAAEQKISTLMGAIEMLLSGTTSVVDCARVDLGVLGDGLDAVMNAYVEIGMRAGVAAQYTDIDFFSSLPVELIDGGEELLRPPRARPDEVLAGIDEFLLRWIGRHDRVQPMLGPSSLPRCSTELFEASVALARRRDVRLQTHLLSARSQVPFALSRYGMSMVDFLGSMGCLEEWASFAHAIWLSDRDVATLAASPSCAVHNPVSNLKLGAGIAPAPALRAAGGRVALGADGASSNDSQNMFETVKMAAILHRIALEPQDWPGAEDVLDMCWADGGHVLGANIGSLQPGAYGDVVVVEFGHLVPGPAEVLRQQLVYGELGSSVRDVVVDGDLVVRDRRVLTVDVDAIRAEAADITARIWDTLPTRIERFGEVEPTLARLEKAVAKFPLEFRRSACW